MGKLIQKFHVVTAFAIDMKERVCWMHERGIDLNSLSNEELAFNMLKLVDLTCDPEDIDMMFLDMAIACMYLFKRSPSIDELNAAAKRLAEELMI